MADVATDRKSAAASFASDDNLDQVFSDQPLGALVDRCAALRKLTIWGCSQLTPLFFNGHKNDALEVVGRGPGQ